VANRGEVVERIARTAGRLDIRLIAPSTEGPDAVDLLDAQAVVRAAVAAGADAVHPGYGFLAESADFAEAVVDAGLRWVGPPPAAMRAMGDKASARRLAAELGIPVLPGYDGEAQDDEALRRAARRVGYPLLVKPSAGGGGKGMRVVQAPPDLSGALAAARREAVAAFGDDRLVLERLLEGPHHVEAQVLADARGSVVHLGERDCSVQRRHQKVLEETPSPAVDGPTRRRLGDAATRLAGAVGYISAGTCEFLLADDGSFWFLEMNTRLQVEHPVTEAVTGRDLVADQLAVAAGRSLADIGLGDQAAVDRSLARGGHAIEVRLYAEDAEAGFLPATGRVERLAWPGGDGIRVDAGIVEGTEVGERFDPMLAKLVAHGRDRREALERLSLALDRTVVLGLVTNLRFLRWLVRQQWVTAGQARIDSLALAWQPGERDARPPAPDERLLTVAALALTEARGTQTEAHDPWRGGWRLNAPAAVRVTTEAGDVRTVSIPPDAGHSATVAGPDPDGVVHVDAEGRSIAVRLDDPPDVDRAARAAAAHHAGGTSVVVAPMPGRVTGVHVQVGDEVDTGVPVATLDAMKMEHLVVAPNAGRVTEVSSAVGRQVAKGDPLATIES
jgi:acetyl-CoA/propionyl-CoA carboxylase biotin carboxyl carrier protein